MELLLLLPQRSQPGLSIRSLSSTLALFVQPGSGPPGNGTKPSARNLHGCLRIAAGLLSGLHSLRVAGLFQVLMVVLEL